MIRLALLLACVFKTLIVFCQSGLDTSNSNINIYSGHYQSENIVKNKFWGNSTYFAVSTNFTRSAEFDLSVGRTFGKTTNARRGLGDHITKSWGIGYSISNYSDRNSQAIKLFYEHSYFPFIVIGNLGLRGEYIYDFSNQQSYLRPSIGWSFVFVDILYNYSFRLNGKDNLYKHGLIVRLKYFINKKNWERKYWVFD